MIEAVFPDVAFVFCTCKRLELFKRTATSVVDNLEDFVRVRRVHVVDDDSSLEDRQQMLSIYPQFSHQWRGTDQRGHARSLNWMMTSLAEPFVAYWEDDCVLRSRGNWLSMARNILASNVQLGAVSLDQSIRADERCASPREWTLRESPHRHFISVPRDPKDYVKPAGFVYERDPWPGFSLKPCLLAVERLRGAVGLFSESNNDHMEYDFGTRCVAAGLHTAILSGPSIEDIGQGTSAYVLNGKPRSYDRYISTGAPG